MTSPQASDGIANAAPPATPPHRLYEDVLALITGALAMSFGVIMLQSVGAVTGGVAGISFLISYASGWSFGVVFFLVNIPFYVLSVMRMGWVFTAKTLTVVALVSIFTELHQHFITLEDVQPFYACIIGGMFMGMGMLILFRHRASAGGLGILALFLQDRFRLSAGLVQLSFDAVIVAFALLVSDPLTVLASIAGVVVLNLILAMNHRPGRYLA